MNELMTAKTKYEELIARMEADIATAEKFKKDLEDRYKEGLPLEALVTIQSQILRIQDYITQKFNNLVEIQRGLGEIEKAIKEAEATA